MPHRIIWSSVPILPFARTKASIDFYEKIGLELVHREKAYLMFRKDEVELHLAREGHYDIGSRSTCYFRCPDVDRYFAQLDVAAEVVISPPQDRPWRMREFHLRDPFGNVLRFGQPATE